MIVETGVLPHVARRMADDPSIETHLRHLAEKFGTARDLKACIAIDVQFHHSLVEASGLRPLAAFADLLAVFFQRFREAIRKVEWKVGVEKHLRLVDLLAAGRVDAAAAELRKQIESNKERL